jgi:hypothetical protein
MVLPRTGRRPDASPNGGGESIAHDELDEWTCDDQGE